MTDDEVEANGEADNQAEASGAGHGVSGGAASGAGGAGTSGNAAGGGGGGNINDELDNLMDISIEIASNKRMKRDYIKPFSLTFRDEELERKYCHQRDLTFKSSLFCVVGVWILVFLSELFQIPLHLDW